MKTHTHTHTRITYTIPGTEIEVELPYHPSAIMDHYEPVIKITDDKIVLGYLADDCDCANPLDDGGMGSIYEARRHGRTLGDYCDALGLRHDGGGPNLDLVDDAEVAAETVRQLLAIPTAKELMLEHCKDYWTQEHFESDEAFIRRCFDHPDAVDEFIDDCLSNHPVLYKTDLPTTEGAREKLWREGRKNGTIGNPYAVLLNIYEHGGIAFSLSGTGMRCQFDTARGGAVWVPDACCVDEIKRRGEVYQKGRIIGHPSLRNHFNVQTYSSALLYDDRSHPSFEAWYEAFQYLEKLDVTHLRPIEDAERDAARELARQAAETYTDWCNGECYGVVVVTYDKGSWTDGCSTAEILDEDSCWGFVGGDHAYESLKNDYFPKEIP